MDIASTGHALKQMEHPVQVSGEIRSGYAFLNTPELILVISIQVNGHWSAHMLHAMQIA
jgi:hypothetical protein